MQVQHELDEGPLEARPEAGVHREPRPRDLGRPLEVEDPQRRAQVPVGPGRELEAARLAHPPHLGVGGGVPPHRHAGVGEVRHHEQKAADRVLHLLLPDLQGLDLVGDSLHLGLQLGCVLLLSAPAGDLLARQALAVP